MGESTRKDLQALSSIKRFGGWIVGALTGVGGIIVLAVNLDVCAPAWQSRAQAAATFETKADADRAHVILGDRIESVEDAHDAQMKEIKNLKANVYLLLGRFGVQPAPEEP